jgi:hypothetical protein
LALPADSLDEEDEDEDELLVLLAFSLLAGLSPSLPELDERTRALLEESPSVFAR